MIKLEIGRDEAEVAREALSQFRKTAVKHSARHQSRGSSRSAADWNRVEKTALLLRRDIHNKCVEFDAAAKAASEATEGNTYNAE